MDVRFRVLKSRVFPVSEWSLERKRYRIGIWDIGGQQIPDFRMQCLGKVGVWDVGVKNYELTVGGAVGFYE